ncbi:MAG TPA: IucA/IucC family protein, partial [Chitinophagales bacterium]|nr:IucA/IucC family protein [Chitinophagales bacterium]
MIKKQISKKESTVCSILERNRWHEVNRSLLCKSLSELMHELMIVPVVLREENSVTTFKLYTDDKDTCYTFKGVHRTMDYWVIDEDSIKKTKNNLEPADINVMDFFIEMQHSIGIHSNNLSRFIEELLRGIYADCFIATKRLTSDELTQVSFQQIEQQMNGHPWLIMNKGRIGFNYQDYNNYTPEAGQPTKLLWLAVSRLMADFKCMNHMSYDMLISNELDAGMLHYFENILRLQGQESEDYFYMPVHEWQWNNKLIFLFANEIALKNIIPLCMGDDIYFAQQSIRTLFNTTNPHKNYVKTSLSILNTTLIRGLSPGTLKVAPMMTDWVNGILQKDEYLQKAGFILLNEVATLSYAHPHFKKINGAPYQYNEMLGVIWRQSVMNHVKKDERPVTMACLLYRDAGKKPFICSLIEKSGLDVSQWVEAYLKAYLSPLIHCFYMHQMFFVPHGENVLLLLNNYIPRRMVL